jgi:hypothetical protein
LETIGTPDTILFNIAGCIFSNIGINQGILTEGGLSTIDLLIKAACFAKRKIIFSS